MFLYSVSGEFPVARVQGLSFIVFPSTAYVLQRKPVSTGAVLRARIKETRCIRKR
jgi:hypothetical protein